MAIEHQLPHRAQVPCSHKFVITPMPGNKKVPDVMLSSVADLFVKAVDLLPVEEMPELLKCVVGGGACFGLLDPVSNIVLNALSYLDRRKHPSEEDLLRRSRMTPQETISEESKEGLFDRIDMEFFQEICLQYTSLRSVIGLVEFMQNYFHYLTELQAMRYLQLAGYDLALAVQLVEHDRFVRPAVPDPGCNRTRAALKLAAHEAALWAPVDNTLLVAASLYPRDRLTEATARLLRREKLRSSDVQMVLSLMLRRRQSAPLDGDSYPVHLTVLRQPQDVESMLLSCVDSAADVLGHPPRQPDPGTSCEYVRCLEATLLDSIHRFYLYTLAMLPTKALCRHLPAILVAGHCYGPLDPVSNIILNAIWFDIISPLLGGTAHARDDGKKPTEFDCANPQLYNYDKLERLGRLSLDGFLVMATNLRSLALSKHEAMEFLCFRNCDISELVLEDMHGPMFEKRKPRRQFFRAAAKGAQHPRCKELAEFHGLLTSKKNDYLNTLRALLMRKSFSAIEQTYRVLHDVYLKSSKHASSMGQLNPRSTALYRLCDFRDSRNVLSDLMGMYAVSHPDEPKYELLAVCSIASKNILHGLMCYHINFLARKVEYVPDFDTAPRGKLFFAEIFGNWSLQMGSRWEFHRDQSRLSFCCQVELATDLGRCYNCGDREAKIVHPSSMKYSSNKAKFQHARVDIE